MATDAVGVSRYGSETAAHFGNSGIRYTFFTSEAPLLSGITMLASTSGSTVLVEAPKTGDFKTTPLNSSVFMAPKKEWANVNAGISGQGQNFVANMTVAAMTNDQKMWMPIGYGTKAFCVSSHSGKDYQSGQVFDKGMFMNGWSHDISWDVRPTAYFGGTYNTTDTSNKHVQILYPRTPSPRWFRRASLQTVSSTKYGSRTFFVYTDLLSRFYVYPVINPKEDLEQYAGFADWSIKSGVYQQFEVDWGTVVVPEVINFHQMTEPLSLSYITKYDRYFTSWYGDNNGSTMTSEYPDPDYDAWMGGLMDGYKTDTFITPTQYLWKFNFNATKATTIAYEKGDAVQLKNIVGEKSPLYKFINGNLCFPEAIKNNIGDNTELVHAEKLKAAKTEQVFDYYPVLLEVSINITLTGANSREFIVDFTTSKNESSRTSNVYYLDAGYSHPIYSNGLVTGGGDHITLSIGAYGDITHYDDKDTPYDVYFETFGDPSAVKDIPASFKSNTSQKAFMDMVISGNYTIETIRNFVDGITDIDTYYSDMGGLINVWFENRALAWSTPQLREFIHTFDSTFTIHYPDKDQQPRTVDIDALGLIQGSADLKSIFGWNLKGNGAAVLLMIPGSASHVDYVDNWMNGRIRNTDPLGKLREYLQGQGYSPLIEAPETDHVGVALIYSMSFICFLMSAVYTDVSNSPVTMEYYTPIRTFDDYLTKYIEGNQVLGYFFDRCPITAKSLCTWYLFDKFLDVAGMSGAPKDKYLSLVAQSLFRGYDSIDFTCPTSWKDDYLKKIPVHACQVIDGVLFSNTDFRQGDVKSGTDYTEYGSGGSSDKAKAKAFKLDNMPSLSREWYFLQTFASYGFGKKINDYKAKLELRQNGNIIKEYILHDAPYVSIAPVPVMTVTLPIVDFREGDLLPFGVRQSAVDNSKIATYNGYQVLQDLGYCYWIQRAQWTTNGDNSSPYKYHANSAYYQLFLKTDATTRANNIVAVDLASKSLMFYGVTSNYHYESYSVGSSLYVGGELVEAYGNALATPPHLLTTSTTTTEASSAVRLHTVRFNMLYRLIAYKTGLEDIPRLPSIYKYTSLLYTPPLAPVSMYPDGDFNIFCYEPTVIASLITSHPNGSISAYSLPPYGFTQTVQDNKAVKGDYTASMTIDYVKFAIHSGNSVSYKITTHKELFNKAFSQGRDYSYYTDPTATDGYMGGFCTAAVWYDFKLPNEYLYTANNFQKSGW